MAHCDTTPHTAKACSGRCMESCTKPQKVWVVAACGGVVSIFEKHAGGRLEPLTQDEGAVCAPVDRFRNCLTDAAKDGKFTQLILVGAANDIAWVHAALPEPIVGRIVAEIQYPLMANWFRGEGGLVQLTKAIEHVFAG